MKHFQTHSTYYSAHLATVVFFAALFAAAGIASAQSTAEQFLNPLQLTSLSDFFSRVYRVIVLIAVPLLSLAFVYAGFLFVTAQGNHEKLRIARENFFYVVVGSVILLAIGTIGTILYNTGRELLGL